MAELAQALQPARRRLDDAAGAEQRLGDHRRRLAGRLRVEQREARRQAGELAARKTVVERAAVAIGRDDRGGAGGQRPVIGVPAGEGQRARRIGEAVEADMRTGDLVAAGVAARDHDSHLVGVGAGFAEEALLQGIGHQRAEPRGKLDLLDVVVAAMGVQHGVAGRFDGGDDPRVVVAERGAHLARIEIEIVLAVDVGDDRVLRRREDRADRDLLVHAGAEGIARRLGEKLGFVRRLRHGASPIGRAEREVSASIAPDRG